MIDDIFQACYNLDEITRGFPHQVSPSSKKEGRELYATANMPQGL
jgi:hypothetical protein